MRRIRNNLWLPVLTGMAALVVLALVPEAGNGQDTKTVTVISTSSGNGEVAPCG